MKLPRFRIAWVMVFVAIVGVNCWAIRRLLDNGSPTAFEVGLRGLPMANILIIVPFLSYTYRGRRRFLWEFEVFGAAAVCVNVALTILYAPGPSIWISFLRLVADPLIRAWGTPGNMTYPQWLIGTIILSLWGTLPQLAFALIGGFLLHMGRQMRRLRRMTKLAAGPLLAGAAVSVIAGLVGPDGWTVRGSCLWFAAGTILGSLVLGPIAMAESVRGGLLQWLGPHALRIQWHVIPIGKSEPVSIVRGEPPDLSSILVYRSEAPF